MTDKQLEDNAKAVLMAWCKDQFAGRPAAPSYAYFIKLVVSEFGIVTLEDAERAIKEGKLEEGIQIYYRRMSRLVKETKKVERVEMD